MREKAYLRVEIIDLVDSGVNVAGMDRLSDLHSRLNGFFFDGKLHVGFFGELFSCPRKAFADQIVHDDEVDITVANTVSYQLSPCTTTATRERLQKSDKQVKLFST